MDDYTVPGCPYCGKPSEPVTGKEIYPHRGDLHNLKFFACMPCDAYVSCHKATGAPMGRLANKELRKAKQKAHWAFDKLWKDGYMKRKEAYQQLADRMGKTEVHIGEMDEEQCAEVVKISYAMLNSIQKIQADSDGPTEDKTGYNIDIDKLKEMVDVSDYWRKAYLFVVKCQAKDYFTPKEAMWLQNITSDLDEAYAKALDRARNE
jgi:hypothetical protein